MKMSPSEATSQSGRNIEVKLAVCKWKLYTGKTQQNLAKELGIPPSYLCDILNGKRPGHKYLSKINAITKKFAS